MARLSGQLLQEKSQRLELEVLLGLREAPKASELVRPRPGPKSFPWASGGKFGGFVG